MDYAYSDIAQMIDHALLKPTLSVRHMRDEIHRAMRYGIAGVCIMPCRLDLCVDELIGSAVRAEVTVGFPQGLQVTAVKAAEAQWAIECGAEELDMVANINKVIAGEWGYVQSDISAVVEPAHAAGRKVKVIFENCLLADEQKIRLCKICAEVGADWVKTSTGFAEAGAKLSDVRLMRKYSPPGVQIKAAGGIRVLDTLLQYRAAGATRIGTSSTFEILDECRKRCDD